MGFTVLILQATGSMRFTLGDTVAIAYSYDAFQCKPERPDYESNPDSTTHHRPTFKRLVGNNAAKATQSGCAFNFRRIRWTGIRGGMDRMEFMHPLRSGKKADR